ncbi:MAG: efflux RND transporter periplasmic adaptor subunit [Prevotellaceae bacterium]|nr:efflux RND transporter periplasmic adaptor subunit [Prevotellaceae bacterium]
MKKRITESIFVALGVLCFSSCNIDIPKEKHTSSETVVVKKQRIIYPVKYSVTIVGQNDVVITPRTSGQLERICITPGQKVGRGQLLFVIDQKQAQISLNNATANLQAAKAQMNSAQLEYESNRDLCAKGIVSDYMVKSALNALNTAKATVAQAEAAVNAAKIEMGYCSVTSPVSGIIGDIPFKVGTQVNEATELTTVSGNDDVTARFSIDETTLVELASEKKDLSLKESIALLPAARLFLKDGSEYPYKGKVKSMSGVMDNMTGSISVEASFPNPKGTLLSGQQGTVEFDFDVENIMTIPQAAIVRMQDKTIVYKVGKDSCAHSVIVTTTDIGDKNKVAVTSGLKEGDKIVATGAANIQENQKVIFGKDE